MYFSFIRPSNVLYIINLLFKIELLDQMTKPNIYMMQFMKFGQIKCNFYSSMLVMYVIVILRFKIEPLDQMTKPNIISMNSLSKARGKYKTEY
jgi:hypothetical protein